jgi:large subunit ribosomal protein L31
MKKEIHPIYYSDAQVTCSCGNTWVTGSTKKTIRTEVCSKCHPFFTGQQQRLIDIEGQVDRFYRKLQARQTFTDDKKAREDARTSTERLIESLTLGRRAIEALQKAGITTVGQAIDKMVEGDQGLLDIQGFGRKSLIDMRKQLRQLGYELPTSPMTEETIEASV